MKKITILLSLFMVIALNNSHAQSNNKSLVAIATDITRIFYIGLDNPLTIVVSGVSPNKVIVRLSEGNLKGNNGKYIATFTHPGEVFLEVSAINGNKLNLLEKIKYIVRIIPDPVNGTIPGIYPLNANIR